MKIILILLCIVTALFSWQKQIIIGSYSVQSNAKGALATFDTQIQNDIQLRDFVKDHSLETINTKISNYTVVSLNAFESYTALLNTMNVLKVYYPDAYVLQYPTQNIRNVERFVDVQKKALLEADAIETAGKETHKDRESSLPALTHEDTNAQDIAVSQKAQTRANIQTDISIHAEVKEVYAEDMSDASVQTTQERSSIEKLLGDRLEKTPLELSQARLKKAKSVQNRFKTEVVEPEEEFFVAEDSQIQEYVIYLVMLAALALLAAGVTVFIITSANARKDEEE